jgi:Sec-independent protein translocase protein TatA
MWEIGLIMLLALLVLGPHQLVEAAKVVGKLYREVQRMAWEVRDAVDLDTPLPTSNEKPVEEKYGESSKEAQDDDLKAPPGERSGPDFYAELLESSKDSDEEEDPDNKEDYQGETGGEKNQKGDKPEEDPARDKAGKETEPGEDAK